MEFAVRNKQKRNNNLNSSYLGNPYIKMIDEKLNDKLNNYCVECGNDNPEYISINNGVFICAECVKNHFKFPNNISKIVKNNIKSLTLNEVQPLLCGGNRALLDFINKEFPKLSEFPPHILYRTQAMMYYRQYLQYLINGGKPPVKPSTKYAYKITNFTQKYNNDNNIMTSENEFYNPISNYRGIYNNNNNNNYQRYDNFYNSMNNFWDSRNINRNNNSNDENNKLINNVLNRDNNYDNYIINKPSQINFQNNNNIIIGKIEDNHNNNFLYSPQRMKLDLKARNKRAKKNKEEKKDRINYESMTRLTNNFNEVYIRPKLMLSPKNINNYREYILNNQTLNQRNKSIDLDNNNYFIDKNKYLSEKGDTNDFKLNNSNDNNYNTINRKLGKMNEIILNFDSYENSHIKYVKNNKYIHKSLSQKTIKNDNMKKDSLIPRQSENNICFRKEIANYNNKKANIKENEKILKFPKRKILSNCNSNKDLNKNKLINNIIKSNGKYSNVETMNYSGCDSLPIKINLRLRKEEPKLNETKDISSYETLKEQNINKNRILSNPKNNKKEEVINEKKNIMLKKKPSRMNKNRSQEDILKNTNNKRLKTINISNIIAKNNRIKSKFTSKK